jgi:hypothetical protein
MRLTFKDKIHGLEKVKFWLVVLLLLLSATLGFWIGKVWPGQVEVPKPFLETVKETVQALWELYSNLYITEPVTFWGVLIVAVALFCIIEYFAHIFRPKKRKSLNVSSISDLVFFQILLYGGTVVVCALAVRTAPVNEQLIRFLSIGAALITVTVVGRIIMVLQDVYVKRNSEDYVYFERNKKRVLIVTTLLGLAVVGLPMWLPGFWGLYLVLPGDVSELLGYYSALLSLTFISISVMSVLSDRSVIIYWDNIAEGKLIKPVFGSFAALTYYSIGAAIGAGISVAARNVVAFIAFCLINIGTIIVLTFNMVDVYYDREGKKAHSVKALHDDLRDYLWVCKEKTLTGDKLRTHRKKRDEETGQVLEQDYTEAEIRNMHIGHRNYEEKMMLLCQYISRANDEHDLVYLQEVYDLFIRNLQCFQTPSGKRVAQMLYANCTEEIWPLMIRSIRDLLDLLEKNVVRNEDPLAAVFSKEKYQWDQDALLWQFLAGAKFLPQWLQNIDKDANDKQELQEFMRLLIRRWVILYNDMVTHGNRPGVVKSVEVPQKKKDLLGIDQLVRETGMIFREITSLFRKKPKSQPEALEYDYLKLVQWDDTLYVRTERGETPDPVQICQLLDMTQDLLTEKSDLAARLTQVMLIMLDNLQDCSRTMFWQYLENFSLPQTLIPH